MEKIIEVGSWPRLSLQPVGLMKVASRGMSGHDRHDFLTKRAAHHIFMDYMDQVKLASGDIPIHLIAIGATEGYGPNRNGDGFNEATCREVHDSFVKHARYYRNHKNKNPLLSYGHVKLSVYNEPMRRIELLVIGNGTKEAADRNGGLIMPDSTISRIYDGLDVPWSMACRVAYDVCSNCFHKSASPREYCTSDMCINPYNGRQMEGCRTGLTKLARDGFQQFVENPHAHMFDISEVVRPAEAQAYGGLADYMMKAAGWDGAAVMGGAQLAEMYNFQNGFTLLNPTLFNGEAQRLAKLAQSLSDIEDRLGKLTPADRASAAAFADSVSPPMDLAGFGPIGSTKLATGLKALAMNKAAMSLRDFLRLLTNDNTEKVAELLPAVARYLPGVYGRLLVNPYLEELLTQNKFAASKTTPDAGQQAWARKQASAHSLDLEKVQSRVQLAAIRQVPTMAVLDGPREKMAADGSSAEALARQYALMKLAFFGELPEDDPELQLTLQLGILQNYAI